VIADRETLQVEIARGVLGEKRGAVRVLRVADLFCGAGGGTDATNEAARLAGYQPEFTLVNHWPVAIATAKANFPDARVMCTSVENIIARNLYLRGQLDVLQGGPECIEFSRATRGRPKNDQYRPTPWCMLRFAEALLPRIVLIENVEEFEKKWPPFAAWIAAFESLGYKHARRIFCAANYGDPTTRRRLFMLFVLPPLRIVWPDATHSPHLDSQLEPWCSAEKHVVDWNLKGQWIDEMPGKAKYGGLPLSPKTFARIYDGIELGGVIVEFDNASNKKSATRGVNQPLSTITSKARHAIAMPYLVQFAHGNSPREKNPNKRRVKKLSQPLGNVTGSNEWALLQPFIVPQNTRAKTRSVKRPLHTVCGASRSEALVEPFLVPGQGDRKGQRPRTHRINAPAPTICAKGHLHLVEPILLPQGGGGVARSVKRPSPTVATDGAIALIEAFFVKYYGTAGAVTCREPLPTVTTKDRFALCCPVVVRKGKRLRLRLRWRMLQWYELAAAQGFRPDYKFLAEKKVGKARAIVSVHAGGRREDVVKQIGNAWPHNLARALMLAALTQQSDIRPFLRKAVAR
jgi:DNA (cytosine-5)-methyltransferase 1